MALLSELEKEMEEKFNIVCIPFIFTALENFRHVSKKYLKSFSLFLYYLLLSEKERLPNQFNSLSFKNSTIHFRGRYHFTTQASAGGCRIGQAPTKEKVTCKYGAPLETSHLVHLPSR